MSVRANLKAIQVCLQAEDWAGAEAKCRSILQFESQNYRANVFLGLALFKLKNYDESESCYNEAIASEAAERQKKDRKENPQPWLGLLNLYEEQGKVDKYMDVALKVAILFQDVDDRTRCQTVIDKVITFVKEHGTNEQYKRALHMLLPDSPIFDFLEGRILHPSLTYQKLVDIIETEEKEKINKDIANRRSRLGAQYGQVVAEVKREVFGASPLEKLYQEILNWSDDEELRRTIDTKLLKHGHDKLLVLPNEHKNKQREKVRKWAEGLVILKYPLELAWEIVIEWRDCENIGEHDVDILREYIQFFPDSGLAKALSAYLESELSPFPTPEETDEDEKPIRSTVDGTGDDEFITPDQRIDSMIEGLGRSPSSVLCHRIVGEYYLLLEEYEGAVEVSRSGQKLVAAAFSSTGLLLQKNLDALGATLAAALTNYQAPKYHTEARTTFEDILSRNNTYSAALVGLGLILEEQQDYAGAVDLLEKALKLDPNNVKIKAEAAWCNVLQGRHEEGKEDLKNCLELVEGVDPRSRDLKAQIFWRIGMAMWNGDEGSRSDRNGAYSNFILALQNNQNFAPAYTSLGIFYADIMEDTSRANKCFQKAFELSAGEVEAAERLARSFAESREWELVEIVARRVAEADKKRSVPGKGISWPQSAIGVVELNSQNYTLAIQAFQSALRASPSDYHSWVGLGEAYASSGRYIAAMKVFHQAEELNPSNWFPKYMLANVHRELGDYEDACAGYRSVLDLRPTEFGVLVALSETLLANSWHYIEAGFFGRAVDAAVESLEVAKMIVKERPDAFNLWKTVGDCCLIFSWVQSLSSQLPKGLAELLAEDIDMSEFDILSDVDGVGSTFLKGSSGASEEGLNDLTKCLNMGILAYKRAIYASADDRHTHAVAWFNLGCAEYRAYVSLPQRKMRYRLAAIKCFKRTIKLEPGNHEFWNALGVATGELNVKVAQHAFVRALYINEKNARVWTNLGTLYTIQNDLQLANEAFSKAQSADPEYALAWVGQGLVASLFGETDQALELFEHAFAISDSSLTFVKRQFSTAIFDSMIRLHYPTTLSSLLGPIFALQKLEQQISSEPIALHLSALFGERARDFTPTTTRLEVVCNAVERRYEDTESREDLVKYAQAKADLARAQLGLREYGIAVENANLALDLSGEENALESCRLSAHLTAGLSNYYLGAMDESLEMFKAALNESAENPNVVCLLAQVLWAKGGEEERGVAREQLFACIERHPDHLQSVLLLGTIGILDNDEDVVEAVLDDLQSIKGRENLDRVARHKVGQLLSAIGRLQGRKDSIGIAAAAIFLRPSSSAAWSNLSRLAPDDQRQHTVEMALKVAVQGKVEAEELCYAYSQMGVLSCDQKAIMVAPWRTDGWTGMVADINAAPKVS